MVALRGLVGEISGCSTCPSGSSFDKVGCEAKPRLIWLRGREFDRWGEVGLSATFDNADGSYILVSCARFVFSLVYAHFCDIYGSPGSLLAH